VVSGIVRPVEAGPEVRRLEVLIGRWITEGHVLDDAGEPATRIVASDVYEWAPGRFFDSQVNATTSDLSFDGEHWIWERDDTRCTAEFSADGTIQTAHHERRLEDGSWIPSMEVVLTKVE
jgi:hypothetical protein